MTKYYIIQFSKEGDLFRIINKCLFDGYAVGDRFLESAMFEISTDQEGQLSVKADEMTRGYLEGALASVEGWEKKVLDYLLLHKGYDNCQASELMDGVWSPDEVHISDDLSFYTDQGMKQV